MGTSKAKVSRTEYPARTEAVTSSAETQQRSLTVCGSCHTDRYLVYEEIKPVWREGTEPRQWDIECWCGQCEEYQGFRTATLPVIPPATLLPGYAD